MKKQQITLLEKRTKKKACVDENFLSIAGVYSNSLARMGAECRKQADFFRDEKRTARFGLETVQQCIWL